MTGATVGAGVIAEKFHGVESFTVLLLADAALKPGSVELLLTGVRLSSAFTAISWFNSKQKTTKQEDLTRFIIVESQQRELSKCLRLRFYDRNWFSNHSQPDIKFGDVLNTKSNRYKSAIIVRMR